LPWAVPDLCGVLLMVMPMGHTVVVASSPTNWPFERAFREQNGPNPLSVCVIQLSPNPALKFLRKDSADGKD
jgi:hypothetical protein